MVYPLEMISILSISFVVVVVVVFFFFFFFFLGKGMLFWTTLSLSKYIWLIHV